MASTSASSVQKSFKYDVFLSFRGEDTRKTFVDHLYLALHHKGITTYKDDEKIEKGERISDQLMRSIEESRYYIIVFSKNYASSSWCLDELVEIMKCQKTMDHTAYPVFYDVEPTEVRHQSGAVEEAFAKHVEKVDACRWRDALKEAADLAGWELKNTCDGHEAKFIQKIVIDISQKLSFINWSVDENLVGMETRVKDVVSSLEIDSDDVRMIGIKGMGGGGKTTLATAVFDHISIWFEGKSFVENVREVSKGTLTGLKDLQKQVLSDVLNDNDIDVKTVSDGKNKIKKMMSSKKVLVVLDDVDHINQLEALAGKRSWFKAGSRIIITTRDEQVLVAHRANCIHDVSLLSYEEAIGLFSRYAFGGEIPIEGYEELSRKVIQYAAGLPLTIKVLGSHLCGRTEREWVKALERLKTIPENETLEKLELSYNGLENEHKEIFLDVACLLKGMEKKEAIRILESCGYQAEFGIRVLEQKSLLNISDINHLHMHDHLEEMGKNIVRRSHPEEPNKRNRLWTREEVEDILVNDLGTDATRSIKMRNSDLLIMKGLRKMEKLRSLYVDGGASIHMSDKVDQYLPNSLQSIYWTGYPFRYLPKTFHANKLVHLQMSFSRITQLWTGYPFRYLPKTFQANKLVHLEMSFSRITQLWEGGEKKVLNKLKYLIFSCSSFRSFDMGTTPNLQILDLGGCNDFVELNMPDECLKLKILKLWGSKVSNLNIGSAPCLKTLDLTGCNHLVELHMPVECLKLEFLKLSGSKVSNLNIGSAPCLKTLDLAGCNHLVELHMPVECLKLEFLILSGSKLSNLNIGSAPCLKTLDLAGCNHLVELHMPVECLKLEFLDVSGSKLSNLNIGSAPCLETLDLADCNHLVELHMPVECLNLEFLDVSDSKLSNLNIGSAPCLKKLDLAYCNHLVELHMPVECLNLEFLNLSGSKLSNLNLGLTPHLKRLDLKNCYFLQEIHAHVGCLKKLVYLDLRGCSRFEYFQFIKGYKSSGFDSVATMLKLTAESLDTCPLHPNSNLPKFRFKCLYDEDLSLSSGNLEKLISFGLCACTNLESFSASICGLQDLRELTFEGSIPEVPKDLYQLESLKELSLSMKEITHLPDSICMLKHLKYLKLSYCHLLEQLPNDLGRLEGLEELHLTDCIFLRDIPNSVCNMKRLRHLNLRFCILVEKLPEEFGRLESLEELKIEGAGISHLPHSIFQLKDLHIVGSTWRLASYGFTSLKEISTYTASCYIKDSQH